MKLIKEGQTNTLFATLSERGSEPFYLSLANNDTQAVIDYFVVSDVSTQTNSYNKFLFSLQTDTEKPVYTIEYNYDTTVLYNFPTGTYSYIFKNEDLTLEIGTLYISTDLQSQTSYI